MQTNTKSLQYIFAILKVITLSFKGVDSTRNSAVCGAVELYCIVLTGVSMILFIPLIPMRQGSTLRDVLLAR